MTEDGHEFTRLLTAAASGSEESREALLALLYDDLRRLSRRHFRQEDPDHTWQPTVLAHEAFLRLIDQDQQDWKNRAHFLSIAARIIRRILVDHARSRNAVKRGAGEPRDQWSDTRVAIHTGGRQYDALDLHEVLARLEKEHTLPVQIVEMRFFGGMTEEDVAAILGISRSTVQRHWAYAKAYLYRALHQS